MNKKIERVKLFPNDNEKSREIAKQASIYLKGYGFQIVEDDFDLAIAVGGDGSFLRMVKNTNFNSDIYYIGINTGTLGFLQEVRAEHLEKFVEKLVEGAYKVDSIGIQETVISSEDSDSHFYSLNEIVIRDLDLNTTSLTIKVDDVLLEHFVGDGILIATSVGSTAYNLSFGGSIVYNTLHTLQITPIAPLNSKSYRDLLNSMIIPENKTISIYPKTGKQDLLVSVDGENSHYHNVTKIETAVKEKRIYCLRMRNYDFCTIVQEKFIQDQ